jgi:apolipoprotein N-acyltransferase
MELERNKTLDLLIGTSRLRQKCALFACGLASGFAMPPFNVWWVWALTFPLFIIIAESETPSTFKSVFGKGWIFGFGYFLAALHWVGAAFFVDAQNFLWMMPFAVGALSGGLAVFWGLASVAARFFVGRGGAAIFIYPLCFAIFEWLRGHMFTGFPWAVPGLSADGMGGVLQLASVIGMNGLTLLVLLWGVAPLALWRGDRATRLMFVVIALSLPAAWAWGTWRVATHPTQFMNGPLVRLVQPNISQSDKWRTNNARAIFNQLLQMSSQAATGAEPTIIAWPESAVPFLIDESAEGRAELRTVLAGKKILLTGAVRRSSTDEAKANYYTSILEFNGNADVIGTYDKHHLVPGGEYLPLAWLIEPLGFRKLVNLPESFTAGAGTSQFFVPGAGIAALQICYEAIFPTTWPLNTGRPDWILNVTNDGWFGNSSGPYQHLAQLRMRSVEQGLGIVRVANTGISAIVDATGGYVIQSKIGEMVYLDSPIPKGFVTTVFAQWGEFWMLVLWCVVVLAAFLSGRNFRSARR